MAIGFIESVEQAAAKLQNPFRAQTRKDIENLRKGGILTVQSALEALEDPKTRIKQLSFICWVLARLHVKRAAIPLLGLLKRKDPRIWMIAATALSQLDVRSVIPPLIWILRTSPEKLQRKAAAYALSFVRDRRAARALLGAFRNKQETPSVRGQAAEGLGNHRHRPAFWDLVKGLNDASPEVRFWSTFALGELGDPRALPYLQNIAKRDKSKLRGWWSIRKEASNMIKSIQMRGKDRAK